MGGQQLVRAALSAVVVVLCATGGAHADDKQAAAKQKEAARLVADGEYTRALVVIDEGLVLAPGRLPLLQLRASTLVEMRDFEGALAAYERFLAANPKGASRRSAQRNIANLAAARTTSLDLTITGATPDQAASVYLDSKSLGVFCTAAPRCQRGILPDDDKIILERSGHKKLTERVTIALGQTLTLERALIEEPSAVTVSVAGDGTAAPAAVIVIDGKELGPAPQALTVEPGDHTLEVKAADHAPVRQTFAAHRGEPVTLAVTVQRLVPIAVNVAHAKLLVGTTPVPVEAGHVILPAGALSLTVRATGFVSQDVAVPAERGSGYRIAVTLAPAPAPVAVVGGPRGAIVRVDGRVVGTVPLSAPIEVAQGARTIEVSASGRAPYRTRVDVASHEPLELTIARMPSTRRRWTWVAAAGTGAALISWGAFGTLALQRSSAFDDRAREPGVTPMDPRLTSLVDDGNTYATVSDVSLGLALVGAAASTWLFLHEGKGESAGSLVPLVSPGAVGVSGAF